MLLLPWALGKSSFLRCCFVWFVFICFVSLVFWRWFEHGGSMAACLPLLFDVGICFLVHGSMDPAPLRPPPSLSRAAPPTLRRPPRQPPRLALVPLLRALPLFSARCPARPHDHRSPHTRASDPRAAPPTPTATARLARARLICALSCPPPRRRPLNARLHQ